MRPISNFGSQSTLRFAQPRRAGRRRGPPQKLFFKPVNDLLRDLHQVRFSPG